MKPAGKRSDHHPALTENGKAVVFAGEVVGEVNQIRYWDFESQKEEELRGVNSNKFTQMAPTYCRSRQLIAFETWTHPSSRGRWDIAFYSLRYRKPLLFPLLNLEQRGARKPVLSGNGSTLAYVAQVRQPRGDLLDRTRTSFTSTNIELYDLDREAISTPPKLNSNGMDTEPSLDETGQLVAFVSDRDGGQGGRDIYLYDRKARSLVTLPGLNSAGHEQSPSLSADGRFIAFVSERLRSAGERDIFLYDRKTETLIDTPGLNSARDEYDPCLIVLRTAQE